MSTAVPTRTGESALAHGATQGERPPLNRDNPWPALDAFHETDRDYFRGRTEDTIDLLRLVMRARVAVLYGVSGIGKSSLLEAGLFPLLRRENALPISIRLDFSSEDPKLIGQVTQAISAQATAAGVEAPPHNNGETLWEYFHGRGQTFWDASNVLVIPVLVFDQFEELFTLGRDGSRRRERVDEFLTQLADLAEGRAPEALQRRLEEHPEETSEFVFGRHHYRVLMGVREDFLGEVDDLRSRMPAIAVNRKRLLAMNGETALEVVNQAKHLFSPGVAEQVVRFVAKAEIDSKLAEVVVEPALLSVMCSELNEKRCSRDEAMITIELLEGTRDQILKDFYERAMKGVSPATRKVVEERLILDPGYRDTVALDALHSDPAVTVEDMDRLIMRRLVRKERRGGLWRVELTHDLLIGAIRKSRDKRHTQEAEEERAARLAGEERERWTADYQAQYTAAIRKAETETGPSQDVLMQLLPMLLPKNERAHLINLARQRTAGYRGNHPLRGELRRLRSLGLIRMRPDQQVGHMKDGLSFDLANYVRLTDLGKRWARTIQQIEKAEAEQALEASRQRLGEAHPNTLKAMNNLAQTLRAQGDVAGARALHERVLQVSTRVLGKEHPDTSSAAWDLHRTLADDGDASAARHVLEENVLWLAERDPGSLAGNQQQIRQNLSEMFGNELQARVTKEVETIRRIPDEFSAREDFAAVLDQVTEEAARSASTSCVPTMVVSPEGAGFRSISMAIRRAVAGARILVRGPAEYRESLIIDKPLEIIGEADVKLVGIGGPAIASTGVAVRIANLDITAEGFNGVTISSGYCVLEDLGVSATRYSGVLVRDLAEVAVIRCSLHHAEHCGLHAQLGSKCIVVGSTVRENGVGGLFFSQGAEALARGNLIEHNGNHGIYIAAGANARISSNQIQHHQLTGVFIYQHHEWEHDYGPGRGTIEDNKITDGDFGIQIQDGADPCVRRNVIKANRSSGIWTRKRGRGTIVENRILENLGPGIINQEGHPLIGQNLFYGNKGRDIEDRGGATQNDRYTCQALKKVLWVDDNPAFNDELIDRYRPLGISFDLALNTKQALDFLAQGDYALIISDIARGADWDAGIRMIPEIRNRFPKAPPIIICAHPQAVEAYGKKAEDFGARLVTASPQDVVPWLDSILVERESYDFG